MLNKEEDFGFEEKTEVFSLLVSLFEEAINQGVNVKTEKVLYISRQGIVLCRVICMLHRKNMR